MKQKLKPDLDLESIQADLIETVCGMYTPGTSVRSIAKDMEMSPMKVRKILITGGVYSTDLSTEIGELWKDGKTPGEIAVLLNTTVSNVNSYLPYRFEFYERAKNAYAVIATGEERQYANLLLVKGVVVPEEEKNNGALLRGAEYYRNL